MNKATNVRITLFWKTALITLGTIGLLTCFIRFSGFWSSYVLDIAGPAWNYILFRGLYTQEPPKTLSRIFTPNVTLALIVSVCFLVETSQYLNLYEAVFDPFDFLAYVSLLIPCYIIDRWLTTRLK